MLLSERMITGFNTDVPHEGRIFHVQTEDRGRDNPVVESLVYEGGTVVAKKSTPYDEQLKQGATDEVIASLLKRQHQVIIAAIKAGRIEDLIRHSSKERGKERERPQETQVQETQAPVTASEARPRAKSAASGELSKKTAESPRPPTTARLASPLPPSTAPPVAAPPLTAPPASATGANAGGLDLDQFISDYLKRNSEAGKLDLKVLTPNQFIAGKSIGLRIQVTNGSAAEPEAIVTVKVIGTAFKPLVYIGRAGRDGVANFSLSLPSFTAGTAAIVIEAQSSRGRGELKHLIRRA
jgi:hypothetical protein